MEVLQKIFPADDFALLVLIIGMPLLGAFVNGVFGKRLGKGAVRTMALAAIGTSFLASVVAFWMLHTVQAGGEEAARFIWHGWQWMGLSHSNEASSVLRNGGAPG